MRKRLIYSLAILAINEATLDFQLLASYCLAWSVDDARAKGRGLAKEKFPESAGYTRYGIAACEMFDFEACIAERNEQFREEMNRLLDERLGEKQSE